MTGRGAADPGGGPLHGRLERGDGTARPPWANPEPPDPERVLFSVDWSEAKEQPGPWANPEPPVPEGVFFAVDWSETEELPDFPGRTRRRRSSGVLPDAWN